MLSIKNNSQETKVWGGYIFSSGQERTVDSTFKAYLSNDSAFYTDILNGTVSVYVDLVLVESPILACEFIRFEARKDEAGNTISRIIQVPDTWSHRAKSLLFTTGLADSVDNECWPLEQCNECQLSFFKEENGALVACNDSESTYTKLVWTPTYKTMQKKAVLCLPSTSAEVRGWVGILGAEDLPQGKLYTGFNFSNRREWSIELMQPPLMEYPFVLILRHSLGAQIQVELMFEYFTNFLPF